MKLLFFVFIFNLLKLCKLYFIYLSIYCRWVSVRPTPSLCRTARAYRTRSRRRHANQRAGHGRFLVRRSRSSRAAPPAGRGGSLRRLHWLPSHPSCRLSQPHSARLLLPPPSFPPGTATSTGLIPYVYSSSDYPLFFCFRRRSPWTPLRLRLGRPPCRTTSTSSWPTSARHWLPSSSSRGTTGKLTGLASW